jgi:limonene-1,2-epoxide hydrolase
VSAAAPTPVEIVTRFLALWEEPDGFPKAVGLYFTPETVWENHGLVTTTGPDEALGFYERFSAETGMKGMEIETLAIAQAADNKVLTERIDWILDSGGAVVMKVPVMGIFEIAGGKIAAWRDYFDTAANSPTA